jgi:hypothetical protein
MIFQPKNLSRAAGLLLLAVAAPSSFSQAFTYANFANTNGLVANQNSDYGPIFDGNRLRLTREGNWQVGSVWTETQRSILRFETEFTFRVHGGSDTKADGFTFTMQGMGNDALGPGGGGLGYGPEGGGPGGIENSVAIKFDFWDNFGEGWNSTGIYFNGESPTVPGIDLTGTGIEFVNEDPYNVRMRYDGVALEVAIMNTRTFATATQLYSVDLASYIGSDRAYLGFTAATGGANANQDILSWSYRPMQAVPEPGTVAALALGLGALATRRRRRKSARDVA